MPPGRDETIESKASSVETPLDNFSTGQYSNLSLFYLDFALCCMRKLLCIFFVETPSTHHPMYSIYITTFQNTHRSLPTNDTHAFRLFGVIPSAGRVTRSRRTSAPNEIFLLYNYKTSCIALSWRKRFYVKTHMFSATFNNTFAARRRNYDAE